MEDSSRKTSSGQIEHAATSQSPEFAIYDGLRVPNGEIVRLVSSNSVVIVTGERGDLAVVADLTIRLVLLAKEENS